MFSKIKQTVNTKQRQSMFFGQRFCCVFRLCTHFADIPPDAAERNHKNAACKQGDQIGRIFFPMADCLFWASFSKITKVP
jgi:hypothetical protein